MFWELKLKVETAIVGDSYNDQRKVFEFPRDEGAWSLGQADLHAWDDLIFNACTSLDLPHVHHSVRMPDHILLPALHLLERMKKTNSGPGKKFYHEMIPRGTVLTLQFMTREKEGGITLRAPTNDDLCKVFTTIGQYEGISPFGGSRGYGRFSVKDLHAVGRAIADPC